MGRERERERNAIEMRIEWMTRLTHLLHIFLHLCLAQCHEGYNERCKASPLPANCFLLVCLRFAIRKTLEEERERERPKLIGPTSVEFSSQSDHAFRLSEDRIAE